MPQDNFQEEETRNSKWKHISNSDEFSVKLYHRVHAYSSLVAFYSGESEYLQSTHFKYQSIHSNQFSLKAATGLPTNLEQKNGLNSSQTHRAHEASE